MKNFMNVLVTFNTTFMFMFALLIELRAPVDHAPARPTAHAVKLNLLLAT